MWLVLASPILQLLSPTVDICSACGFLRLDNRIIGDNIDIIRPLSYDNPFISASTIIVHVSNMRAA